MKDLSPNHQFLSISVEQCLNRLFLQQMQYVLDILECVCMTVCKPCFMPVDTRPMSHTTLCPY
jgi:hypothetical protein